MFGFALDTGNDPEIITFIDQVKNIEGANPIAYKKIRLVNVHNVPNLISAIENASKIYENNGFIYNLDQENNIISGTFISSIKISKSKKNIILTGFAWTSPKGYQKAMDMKLNNEMIEKIFGKILEKTNFKDGLCMLYILVNLK